MTLLLDANDVTEIPEIITGIFDGIQEIVAAPGYKEVLPTLNSQLANLHETYFNGAHDPNGNAWAPLAPSTIQRKGHDRILIDTGALRSSLTTLAGPDAYRDLQDNGDSAFVVFGTTVEYAGYHMTGTSRMPARPEVGVNEDAADRMANAIADHVVAKILAGLPA